MKWASMVAGAFAVMTLAGMAKADPKGTYTTHVVEIVGRNLRPNVVVEVRRVEPAPTVSPQKLSVASRVDEAVTHDPF